MGSWSECDNVSARLYSHFLRFDWFEVGFWCVCVWTCSISNDFKATFNFSANAFLVNLKPKCGVWMSRSNRIHYLIWPWSFAFNLNLQLELRVAMCEFFQSDNFQKTMKIACYAFLKMELMILSLLSALHKKRMHILLLECFSLNSHRLYRTQTTQNAVAKPPVNTTMARIIVANSDVFKLEPL